MRKRLRFVAPGLVSLVLLPLYLATLAPGLTWANDGADGGDLITAAAVGGVAHPTGYPTYLLLARAFQLLPVGSLAYRANLLSAAAAAATAGLVVALTARSARGAPPLAWASALAAGLGFGMSSILWAQAVIAEVYALHGLMVGLILVELLPGSSRPERPLLDGAAGLLFGLALGNHLTTALLLPPWLVLGAWRGGRLRLHALAVRLLGLALGAGVYLYLPLRARAVPPVNWGDASTWQGFWWVVSGQPYRSLAFSLPAGNALPRLQAWAGLVVNQFGLLGLVAGFYGLFFGRAAPAVKWTTGWTALAFSLFAIGYGTPDSYAYLLPAFLAFAVWVGLGLAAALAAVPPRFAGFQPALLGLFLLFLLFGAGQRLPQVDASRDGRAEAFGRGALALAPPGALVFTRADRDTFSLWYFHFALGQRRDVAVLVEPLLVFDWYRASLRAAYPDLAVPDRAEGSWQQTVVSANVRRALCETRLEAPVSLACAQ